MKKVIALVLAVIIILSATMMMPSAATKKYKGDMDGDGNVTAIDARIALQIAVGSRNPTMDQSAAGDMNGKGGITAADARIILQVAVGELQKEELKDEIDWGDV